MRIRLCVLNEAGDTVNAVGFAEAPSRIEKLANNVVASLAWTDTEFGQVLDVACNLANHSPPAAMHILYLQSDILSRFLQYFGHRLEGSSTIAFIQSRITTVHMAAMQPMPCAEYLRLCVKIYK